MALSFAIEATAGLARKGHLLTAHGAVETPAFMPVGTLGAVKGVPPEMLEEAGASILLSNLYHLTLRPSIDVIERLGGLHRFVGWPGPILTDSGGYQVFSLGSRRSLDDDGVTFRSHLDGSAVRFTPESVVDSQVRLGVDIAMVLDECPPHPVTHETASAAWRRTLAWERRARAAWPGGPRRLFGIVQGSSFRDLRERAVADLMPLDFDGYAIGGVSVGEPEAERKAVVEWVAPILPTDKPRYLMGVGTPEDLILAVEQGIDMFDCVMPTRAGRHGLAYTFRGKVNLKNAAHAEDICPLDSGSACPATRDYSRAYLHHLVKCNEYLAAMLLTWSNVAFYQALMAATRDAIAAGRFQEFKVRALSDLATARGRDGEP